MSPEQKVAVITGASRGIGASLTKGFRELGYCVVVNARSIDKLGDSDPAVVAVAGDVARSDTADRIVCAALNRFGRIDTLVNNAGIFISRPFTDYSESDYAAVTRVSLDGFFQVTRRAAPCMLDAGSGHIVTITAAIAEQPIGSLPAALTALTKGGLNAVTRALAIEYAQRGVRVNAVSPGVIRTPMHAPEMHGFLDQLQPMGRMGETGDVVDAVLYLEKASFVTGEILHVDGGSSAGRS
jgi:NAD(P)-dependent dehydrogenase (short-subunit alcohol dehydrogenase family)